MSIAIHRLKLSTRSMLLSALCSAVLASGGCKSTQTTEIAKPVAAKNYTQPLPPGVNPLRKVEDQALYRRLLEASYSPDDPLLLEASKRAAEWFRKPSAKGFFPVAGVTFDRARASVDALLEILQANPSQSQYVASVMDRFDLYESVGWDGSGEVLFTGYCAMDFDASRTRSSEFNFPLYTRPADLVVDERTGKVLGQRVGNTTRPYPTRREIEESGMLAGTELVYVRSPLDAYFIQVNGSAKLWLEDGSVMYLGYSGTNGREYTGLGATMIKRGIVDPSRVGLPFIKDYYKAHPQEVLDMIRDNDRYVFFTAYESSKWPAGSLGYRVTEKRTIATDKEVFPRGGAVIVDTRIPTFGRTFEPFTQLMFDQDTGGAIKAPGRGDLYMGEGAAAGLIAGRQYQEGRLYYLFLKESTLQADAGARR